jgi:VCBS repeat-containing protein
VLVTDVSHGSLTLNSDGSFDYTPDAGWSGQDSFTYKANDGTADSGNATVTITVNAVNDPPTANDDSYSTDEDTELDVLAPGVLGNDTDPEDDTLTASVVSQPSHGSLMFSSDGSFSYSPTTNYNGSDSFTYEAHDGTSPSNAATVNLTVNAVNDAPVASDDSYSTDQDTTLNVSAPGVLDNDSDVEGDTLTAIKLSDPSNGSVTLNSDGSFDYTPDSGYTGDDTFTYKANDGAADSGSATVTITVEAAGDIYVDDDYDSGTPGWQVTHFDNVQDGIDAASAGEVVLVYAGTYTGNISFSGKDITLTSEDPDDPAVVAATVIDGGAAGSVVTFANGETSAAVLEGFTVQNGSASDGGGIYCSNTSPTIQKNVVTGNVTSGDGGGIYTSGGSPDIVGNTIYANDATNQNAGGIWYENGSGLIENNLIYENSCYWNGGGIYCSNSSPAIVNNTIADNVVVYETCAGGAIRVLGESAAPTVTNCLLWGNTAGTGDQIAIKTGATLTVSYSDVQGGEAGVAVQTADCTLNWGSGNIDSDPQFVDSANDDYHIGSGSPCIDAADGGEAPSTDMEGNGRVDDPNTTNTGTGTPDYADIGSYEYQGS